MNGPAYALEDPQETIRLLQAELELTNREVLALTLELEKRVDERTAELQSTQVQLQRSNAELRVLTAELEKRVLLRTRELEESNQAYRRLVENAPDIIFRYELQPKRGFTFMSPLVAPITGYSPEEYYADPELGLRIVHPDDRRMVDAVIHGDSPASSISVVRIQHKSGATVWIEQHHVVVQDHDGKPVAIECIARDVSEGKNLEEQLRQAQKMEAVGRLAGGIAHDFNNLLTIINGYSELMLDAVDPDSSLHGEIAEVHKAGERAAGLTRQLLAFSRRQVFALQVLDLNAVVVDVERMLRRVLGEDVELAMTLAPRLDSVHADRGQIEQVLMNLAVNARDAMPDGGRLVIETANVELGDAYASQHRDVVPGRYVMLAVRDTGHGMDAQTMARIFEPFFTTKPQGKGTGLGLSTVYGIVRQSGGTIAVESDVGHGTTFQIYLPRVMARPDSTVRKPAMKPASGTGTILVVEDEAGVRGLILMALTHAGYKVIEARNGAEALILSEQHAGTIDLVITDMVMPHMGGRELAVRLASRRPDMKVLYMSGYTDSAQQGDIQPETPFLQKPFTPGALARKVREMVGGK